MSIINNFSNENKCVKFQINNTNGEFKISFPNCLRRIIISYIDCYCIDFESIKFSENNSLFNNEFLKERLKLIPIISNNNEKYELLKLSCDINNDTEIIQNIYISEFTIKDTTTNKEYDISKFIEEEEILFTKLQSNQKINFDCSFIKSNAFTKGASFCPVSSCVVTFHNSDYDNEAIIDRERNYDLNSINEPKIYNFSYESIGFYKPEEIVKIGCQVMIEKLNNFKNKFDDFEFLDDFYNFHIKDENDTLGNVFTSYLLENKEIKYCGYENIHPLKNEITIKIKIEGKKEKLMELIESTIDDLIKKIENIKKEFK